MTLFAFAALLICYLIGSCNLSVILSKAMGRDVRGYGSGNAGSTNMLRTFGWKAAIPVFLGDIAKGVIATLFGIWAFSLCGLDPRLGGYCGATACLLGHVFPVWFGFHGGKGIAICIGTIIALFPIGGTIILICGLAIAGISGYVSLGSILSAAAFPFLALAVNGVREFIPALIMCILVIYFHRENIRRLIEHRENKFSPPKKK